MKLVQNRLLDDVQYSPLRETFAEIAKYEAATGKNLTKFTIGQPDFNTPEYIRDACKRFLDEGFTGYGDTNGVQPLREAIARKLKKENNVEYSPDEIFVTVGAAQAAFMSIVCWLNPGDEILIPNPVYQIYAQIPKFAGATVKEYHIKEENDFQIDFDELKSLITPKTKMIALCNPNNPTGSILTRETLEKLADTIKDTDILVVSDEIYEKLVYDGEKATSFASIPGMKERTLTVNGCSKAYSMTGWRIGYIAAPLEFQHAFLLWGMYDDAGGPNFVQQAAAVAFDEDDGSTEAMRQEFDRRRKYLCEEINKLDNFSCLVPKGAFYVFLNIKKTGMTSDQFRDFLMANCDTVMVPGSAFGSEGEGFMRISYAASMDTCKAGVAALQKADKILNEKK